MPLTDTGANRALDWATGNATTAPVLPLKLRLMTVAGSGAAPGTEVVGGSYTPQSVAVGAAAGRGASNTALLRFEGLPACTVVAVEVWDSAAVPVRWWHGALTAPRTVAAGDLVEFAAGELDLTLP